MRRRDIPPNTQTIGSLREQRLGFEGMCSPCKRVVRVDMDALIRRLGAETLVTAALGRIICSSCGARVEMQVVPLGVPRR